VAQSLLLACRSEPTCSYRLRDVISRAPKLAGGRNKRAKINVRGFRLLRGDNRSLQYRFSNVSFFAIRHFLAEEDVVRAPLALVFLIAVLATSARAESLQIKGKFGYLDEYEFFATENPQTSGTQHRLAGPLTVKHVGVCAHSGPQESQGEIILQFIDAKSPIEATLAFDGRQCRYKGRIAEHNIGELSCSGDAVPFSIWFRM
jgi:hypothetical protein